jgi:hypothetical protein
MCNAGEYTERACLTDADCPDDAVGGVPGPPIPGACETGDYGGTVELDLAQGEPYLISPVEYAAKVSGSSLFNGSPCWNPIRWDPSDPGWGVGTYPWKPPIFSAILVGTEVGESSVFQLKGDNAYAPTGTPEKVPNVLLATVDFVALGNVMWGPLSVGAVPRTIGSKGGFLNPSSPYDPDLASEASVCVGRLGNASITRN